MWWILGLGLLAAGAMSPVAGAAPLPFQPTPLDEESYSEQWSVIADLEDGTYVQVQLGVSNVGFGDGHGMCRLLVVDPKGTTRNRSVTVGASDWQFAAAPYPRLRVAGCAMRGGMATEVSAAVGDTGVLLTLEAGPTPTSPPGHLVRSGADADAHFYTTEILVPWAVARVELRLEGKPRRVVRGHAYLDHSRATSMPAEIARGWVRFRAVRDEGSMLLLARFPPGNGPGVGWLWRQGEERAATVSYLRSTAVNGDAGWVIDFAVGGRTYRISSGRRLFRFAPLEEVGVLGPAVRAMVGNPVTFTFRGSLTSVDPPQATDGILEVSINPD